MSYPFPTFPLVNRVGITTPVANVDARYGPWLSISDALTAFNAGLRFKGLTVGIYVPNNNTNSPVVEYWYKDGVADGNLVLKQTGGGGSVQPEDILPTVTNYLSTNNVLVSSLEITDRFVVDNQLYYTTDNRVTQLSALSGNYDEGQFLGRVKLSQNNTRLVNVGNTWTAKDPNKFWISIAMSSDGKYQSAVVQNEQIYVSSDYGNTWTVKESIRDWYGIAMSSDGKYQSAVVINGQIYISNDYGNTWTVKESIRGWLGIAMSSDGKYQSAVVINGQIYISNDYGNTWTAKETNRGWQGIAMSSDGKYQSAVVQNEQIYVSSDYGNTWTPKDSNRNWRNIAMSSDGKYQSAVVYSGQIYISSNYGNTWTAKDFNRDWRNIAMSSDGKYQSVVVLLGRIYISNDYGNTWTPKDSNRNWRSIAMSSDGKYQSAVVYSGQIYTSVADELIDGSLTVTQTISTTGGTSSQWNNTSTYVQSNSGNFPQLVLQLPNYILPATINSQLYGTVYQTVSADTTYVIILNPGNTLTLFISGNHDSLKRHTIGFVHPEVYQFYITGAGQTNYFYTFKNHVTKVTLTNPLSSISPTPRLMGIGTAEIIRTDLNQGQGGLGFLAQESASTDQILQENGDRLVIRNFV